MSHSGRLPDISPTRERTQLWNASGGKGAFFGLYHGLRRVSERYGCLGGAFASARYGCLDGGAHRFGTMEAPQRRPLADDWHGGDSTDVLDAEDEAAYIAGTRTRLEGVPRRPDSPSSLTWAGMRGCVRPGLDFFW